MYIGTEHLSLKELACRQVERLDRPEEPVAGHHLRPICTAVDLLDEDDVLGRACRGLVGTRVYELAHMVGLGSEDGG